MLSTVTERFLFLPHPVPSKLESVSKQAIRSTVRRYGGRLTPSEPCRCHSAPKRVLRASGDRTPKTVTD